MSGRIDLETLNAAIQRWGHRVETLAILTGIKIPSLYRKLAGKVDFTVGELFEVSRVLELRVGSLFIEEEDGPRELHRVTEPGQPEHAGIGGGL